MNFIKSFVFKILFANKFATNKTIALFEDSFLSDADFYKDVESWGGIKIAAAAKDS